MKEWGRNGRVILKDSTMREGVDVPGVALDQEQKRGLLKKLAEVGVQEVELVAPGHFDRDLKSLKEMGFADLMVRRSGLIYGNRREWREQVRKAKGFLDRMDILIPLSSFRPPSELIDKLNLMRETLLGSIDLIGDLGVGFPHATQVDQGVLLEMCHEAVKSGAKRITLYDTNGSSDPWNVARLIESVRSVAEIEICFHAHNDLGMATANSLAAVRAGAGCLDVTVNGLGDRAGNASLEQVAVALHLKGVEHGLRLGLLRNLSQYVAAISQIPVSKLAPIVGEFAFCQKSPSHLEMPKLFEPFDPELIGAFRSLCEE